LPFSNSCKYKSKTWYIGWAHSTLAKKGGGGFAMRGFWILFGTPLFRVGGPLVHEPTYSVSFFS